MNREGVRMGTRQSAYLRSAAQMADKAAAAWRKIRTRIVNLVREGIDALIFTFDEGAQGVAASEELRRRRVCDAIRETLGDSPAELLLQASPEMREQLIAELHIAVAQGLNIEASVIVSKELDGACGAYFWRADMLCVDSAQLEKQPMTLTEAKEIIDTICHETYHSFQRRAIVRPSRYGVLKSDAQIWRINFKNYVQPEQNPERYWTQPVEVSARMFAGSIIGQFY